MSKGMDAKKETKKQPTKTLKEKRKAVQEAKALKAQKSSTNEAGRVGDRPYARGRSYRADRYDD